MPAGARPGIADGVNRAAAGRHRAAAPAPGPAIGRARPPARPAPPNKRDRVWFVGYTPDLATAVWAGNPSRQQRAATRCRTSAIGGVYYGDVCGGYLAGPIWQQMMSAALAGMPVDAFTGPVGQGHATATCGTVPAVIGASVDAGEADAARGQLDPASAAPGLRQLAPRAPVAYTLPGAGRGLPRPDASSSTGSAGRQRRRPQSPAASHRARPAGKRKPGTATPAATPGTGPAAASPRPAAPGRSAPRRSLRRTSAATRPPSARPATSA